MEAKGDQLMAEAEAELKKFSLSSFFGGGQERFEAAGGLYGRAGNTFKACKQWPQAAKAFKASAEMHKKLKDEMETTQAYVEASRMLIKAGNPQEATSLLEGEALPRMVDAGRLAQAAKLHDEVAKMFEDEHEFGQAIEHYGKAADLFGAENSASTAQKCKQSVARLSAMLDPPDYEKASEAYAECGMEAMASQLLKFGAKECFQRAVFCTLARNDLVTASQQFEKFKEQDYTLEGACWPLLLHLSPAPGEPPPLTPLAPLLPPSLPQAAARASCWQTSSRPLRCRMGTRLQTPCTITIKSLRWTTGRSACSRQQRSTSLGGRAGAQRAGRAGMTLPSCRFRVTKTLFTCRMSV